MHRGSSDSLGTSIPKPHSDVFLSVSLSTSLPPSPYPKPLLETQMVFACGTPKTTHIALQVDAIHAKVPQPSTGRPPSHGHARNMRMHVAIISASNSARLLQASLHEYNNRCGVQMVHTCIAHGRAPSTSDCTILCTSICCVQMWRTTCHKSPMVVAR